MSILFDFLNEIKNKMTPGLFQEIKDDISKGNFEMGFSMICSFLTNYQIPISVEYYEKLLKFNKTLNRSDFYISHLKRLSDADFEPINYQKYIDDVLDLLKEMKNEINPETVKIIEELAKHDEWGLAFEILCEYLECGTIPITNDFYEKLSAYNMRMNFPEERISSLKSLTKLQTLTNIIDEMKTKFSEDNFEDIYAYIAKNDWKSAFEMLCVVILNSNDVTISQRWYDQLKEYAKLVYIPESEIVSLKNLIDEKL